MPAPRRRIPAAGRRPPIAGQRRRPDPDPQPAAAPERGAGEAPQHRPRVLTLVAVLAVLVIASGLAVWFRGEATRLTDSAAAENDALVDPGTTARVDSQISDALETVFSYDHTTLDKNARAARQVVTGQFAADFGQQFDAVRELAPQQQAVVVATVSHSALQLLQDDTAVVVAFLDQQVTRGPDNEQLVAAGRVTVTAQRVDGQWKIADVQSS